MAISRIVRPVAGSPRIRVVLRPMRDYGAAVAQTTHGSNHIRYLVGPQAIRLSTDSPVGYWANESFERIYGFPAPSHVSQERYFLDHVEPEDALRVQRSFLEAIRSYAAQWEIQYAMAPRSIWQLRRPSCVFRMARPIACSAMLIRMGYSVTAAVEGKEALSLLDRGLTFEPLSPSGYLAFAFEHLQLDEMEHVKILKKPYGSTELAAVLAEMFDF